MQTNTKNVILLALIGVATGVTGLIAFYQQISWLFIICTILCVAQFVLSSLLEPLKDEVLPYLAVCLAVGYYLTDNIPDTACFGICLYYATALIFLLLLSVIPGQIVMIVVPIVSIAAYFLNAEHVFLITAAFCFIYFLVKHFRGKNPPFAMDILLWCIAFGVSFLCLRNTDTYLSVKILKGLLWGSAAYYIVGIFYAFYHSKKGNWQNHEDDD